MIFKKITAKNQLLRHRRHEAFQVRTEPSLGELPEEIRTLYQQAMSWSSCDWSHIIPLDSNFLEFKNGLTANQARDLGKTFQGSDQRAMLLEAEWLEELEEAAQSCRDIGLMAISYEIQGKHALADHFISQCIKTEKPYHPTPEHRKTWLDLSKDIRNLRSQAWMRKIQRSP